MAASAAWLAVGGFAGQCAGRLGLASKAQTDHAAVGVAADSGGAGRFNGFVVSVRRGRVFGVTSDQFCLYVGEFAGVYGRGVCVVAAHGGWSRTDALLAVYPGALAAVLDVFHVTRASNHVVLVHLLRLFVLTLLVTVLIPAAPMTAGQVVGLPVMQNGLSIGLLLLTIVGVGLLLRRWHVPAPYLLTAMVLTAWATHAGYVPPFAVPRGMADATTVLLGVLIGSILADLRWVDVLHHGRTGAMVLLIAIAVTALFAAVAAWVLD